jgi:sugar phosphate isomerase/epimerase
MGYHNHEFEFEKFDGQVAYDLMLKELDPKNVSMELDLYWVNYANQNALEYFAKYPGRFEQWHVKDMDKTDPKKQVDVGTGRIDFPALFAKAKQSGLKHFYVEQEAYPVSPMDSIEKSIANVKKWI